MSYVIYPASNLILIFPASGIISFLKCFQGALSLSLSLSLSRCFLPTLLLNAVVGSFLAKKSCPEVWQSDDGRGEREGVFALPPTFLPFLPSHLINLCPTSGPSPTKGDWRRAECPRSELKKSNHLMKTE